MRTLKRGDSGGDVIVLQRKLGIKVTGLFDRNTELAVKAFQMKHGLVVNGVVGFKAWEKLFYPTKPKDDKWYLKIIDRLTRR